MKYRDYKTSAAGSHIHVFNRGNGKMDIFKDDQDYRNFLKRLYIILNGNVQGAPLAQDVLASRHGLRLTPFEKEEFSIVSFCLMPNHFHLQVLQNADVPVGKLLLKLCTSYSMYFNRKYKHVGHVFQDQFKAVPITTDRQLAAVSAYVHQNPKVAGLVKNLIDWPHSSYSHYGEESGVLSNGAHHVLGQFKNVSEYRAFVEEQYERLRDYKDIGDEMMYG